MKSFIFLGLLSGAILASQADPNLLLTNETYSAAASKACIPPPTGWTIIDCSNVAAAESAQLNSWSRYILQCGVNSYISFGTASATADDQDGYLPAGSWFEFGTDATTLRVSCLNKDVDDDCRYIECK